MNYKEIVQTVNEALELSKFKEMDYFAVEKYHLPIELMMENAGLQLANLAAQSVKSKNAKILIGVGNGNNGGGGLVAARRLAAWGFEVYINAFTKIDKTLPNKQMERAILFGAKQSTIENPDIWIDAYLGFSQKLPLTEKLNDIINKANNCDCLKISLDIPTGFSGDVKRIYFDANQVLTLAASKKILFNLPKSVELFIADLGISKVVYEQFNTEIPPFENNNIIKIKR